MSVKGIYIHVYNWMKMSMATTRSSQVNELLGSPKNMHFWVFCKELVLYGLWTLKELVFYLLAEDTYLGG